MRGVDLYIIYRIIKALVTPWDKMPAYNYGIIDAHGNVLRKMSTLRTPDEKNAYDLFYRFVFNLKRLIELVPGGKTKIGTFAAAMLLLLKENENDALEINLQFEMECIDEDMGSGGMGIANNASSGLVSMEPFWDPNKRRKKRF